MAASPPARASSTTSPAWWRPPSCTSAYTWCPVIGLANQESLELSLINRVKGLRSFWNDLEQAPVSREAGRLMRETIRLEDDRGLWANFENVSRYINGRLARLEDDRRSSPA
jgi:hypothetical protein